MAYFNNSFQKLFMGTKNQAGSAGTSLAVDQGFLNVSGIPSVQLSNTKAPYSLGVGTFGLFTADTYLSIHAADSYTKPLILAASALYQKDKVSPTLGGYQESTKSKLINPKYVSQFYRVDPCLPNQNVVHLGTTPYVQSLSPAVANCQKDFQCDTTYYLRIDIKGSPALRYLTHNAYWVADAYTGCCPANCAPLTPNNCVVDPTTVYIKWADQLVNSAPDDNAANGVRNNHIVGPFIQIVVFDTAGLAWYQPGTNNGYQEWNSYVSPGGTFNGLHAGMKITGAYAGTVFGDCTFYPTDFFEREPVKIIVSETDWNGLPCSIDLCVTEQCAPRQGMGFGDTVLKDLILSESYMQNYFNTNMDLRLREVTQGYDVSSAVNRSLQYYRYYILHSVPRFNNPTGMFDNDQYLLEIITLAPSASFETTFTAWLQACVGEGCAVNLDNDQCGGVCPICTTSPGLAMTPATGTVTTGSTITMTGGFLGTPTFAVTTGTLPVGITFNGATGHFAGSSVVSGTYHFTITATDANGCQVSTAYTLVVS